MSTVLKFSRQNPDPWSSPSPTPPAATVPPSTRSGLFRFLFMTLACSQTRYLANLPRFLYFTLLESQLSKEGACVLLKFTDV